MRSNVPPSARRAAMRALVLGIIWIAWTLPSFGQTKPYTPKNGILNWKAVLLGGAFRVTTAIPLHGDFSKYHRLEIVRTESLIGRDAPVDVMDQLTLGVAAEFRKGDRFSDVAIVDAFSAGPPQGPPATAAIPASSFRDADPIDAPMRHWEDLQAFDRQRQAEASAPERPASETLLVRCQVIDYAKGNKVLQILFIDLGNSILTLRFSYFDKASGEELGRSIVSSDNSSKAIPSVLSTRTALTGVIEGLVDQVTRRKVAGER